MIPPPFDYAAPASLSEAVSLLHQNSEAKILAGGQSLIPLMRFRLASPAFLIDINHLAQLDYIREENGWLKIGALTREVALERSRLVQQKYPLLADTSRMIADPLVRNMATIGGNLAHADPANDHPATMLAFNALIVARGPEGERQIPATEFFTGLFESALAHDEILTEIRIPAAKSRSGGAYFKLERKVGDFATAAVAVQISLDENGACLEAGIGLTNVGLTPIKATEAEEALKGQMLDEALIKQAAHLASQAADPGEDPRGSVEYKRSMIQVLTTRALKRALERARGGIQ
jgi:aerobic carbon-monoxide dehydrogenase medium subunit